jgi:hypothetical protein
MTTTAKVISKMLIVIFFSCALPLIASASTIGKPANNLGLVGYWPMNEGTSTSVGDASGNHNTATNNSSTSWTSSGRFGSSFASDGSASGYVVLPQSLIVNTGTTLTLSVWFKTTSSGAIFGIQDTSTGGAASTFVPVLYIDTGGLFRGEFWQGGVNPITSTNTYTDGKWHQAVLTGSATTQSLYIDGVFVNSLAGTITHLTMTNNQIGAADTASWPAAAAGWTYFNGSIDDVRLYSRALSSTEVAVLYKSGAARAGASSASLQNGSSLQSGLAGLWTMDGSATNWKTGTMSDSSGNGNTGLMNGFSTTSSPTAGKLGQAMKLTGTEYIDVGNSSSVQILGNISLAAWTKLTALPAAAGYDYVIGKGYDGTNEGYYLRYHNPGAGPLIECGVYNGGDSFVQLAVPFAAGTMHHLACTYDGTNWNLYIDGALANSNVGAFGALTTSLNTYIGVANVGAFGGISRFFSGTIDDVRLYNRTLSATEIKQLFNLGSTTYNASSMQLTNGSSLQSGLVGLWTFDGSKDKLGDRRRDRQLRAGKHRARD